MIPYKGNFKSNISGLPRCKNLQLTSQIQHSAVSGFDNRGSQAIDRWINGSVDQWIDGSMNQWIDGSVDRWLNRWMDQWTCRSMDGWISGSMDQSV